ncbi:MAG: hypothetical protein Q8P01_04680 [bacterium]|nr:hypothetical protein [bacterium]
MRILACCFIPSLLVGLLGCGHRSSFFYADPHAWATLQETGKQEIGEGSREEERMIHAEAEGSGVDYDSAELLATMNAVSQIGEQIGTCENAVIARPDFRVFVLQIVRIEPFLVRVHAVILAPRE